MDYRSYEVYQDRFKKDKPKKYIYPKQENLLNEFSEFIIPYLRKNPFFKRVWVWGSLAKGHFGIYSKKYNGEEGSDVDLLVEVDENYKIPKELRELREWTKKRTYSRAFYSNLRFKNKLNSKKDISHKVDFICHFPTKHTKSGFYNKTFESKLIYEKKELKFSVFTDVHYDLRKKENTSKGIKGEESVINLPLLVDKLKKAKQDFVVNLGDLVGSKPEKSFPRIINQLKKIKSPLFHVVGNHELELMTLKELKKVLELKSSYYSEEVNGYKLIFLNSFDRKASKPDKRRRSRVLGGPISGNQARWLKNELKVTKDKAIIFIHKLLSNQDLKDNPIWALAPERYTKVENAQKIRKILEDSKKVLAVFQGHIHQNSMKVINNIPYFSIQSFCQNKNYSPKQKASKSYALVDVKNNSITVDIKGDKKLYKI